MHTRNKPKSHPNNPYRNREKDEMFKDEIIAQNRPITPHDALRAYKFSLQKQLADPNHIRLHESQFPTYASTN